jgi:rod shape-determining protein MreC
MQYSPPSFFKQGPDVWVRLVFFSLLSIALLIVDARFQTLDVVRQAVAVALYPFQRAVLLPGSLWSETTVFFESKTEFQREADDLARQRIEMSQVTTRATQLAEENAQLRRMLGASARVRVPSVLVEVLYEVRDAFSRRLIVDKGANHGLAAGMPLIDDGGVVGQVVRVSPLTSEVALLTDRDQMVPVQVLRNGVRSVAFGDEAPGRLGLRFMASDIDVQVGDDLVTSGLDGIYPAGLPVAKVDTVERDGSSGFARILAKPVARLDRHRHFLVLQTVQSELPALPAAEEVRRRQARRP